MKILLREVELSDSEKAYSWRNQELNRSVSGNSDVFSRVDHETWWTNMLHDESMKVFVFATSESECGIVTFSNIDLEKKTAFWGFYLDTESQVYQSNPMAIWFMLEKEAIELAKDLLNLKSLKCSVAKTNKAVLMVHKKFGFRADTAIGSTIPQDNALKLVTLELIF